MNFFKGNRWLSWANKIIYAALGLALLYGVVLFDLHEKGWLQGGDNIQSRAQIVTGNAQVASANVAGITATVGTKAAQIDVQPLNGAFRNVQAITRNVVGITGDVKAVTGEVNTNLPIIEEGAVLLWQHVDDTVGHLDVATKDERAQQKQLAEDTSITLQQTRETVAQIGQLAKDLRPVASHADTFMASAANTMQSGEHVAKHYETIITAPKRWYQKLKDWGEALGSFTLRHA